MLGKLVKYDLKYAFRIFLLVHGIYLLICILLRLLVMNQLDFSKPEEVLVPPITLILILEIFLLSAVSLTTSLLIALRFYRNLVLYRMYFLHMRRIFLYLLMLVHHQMNRICIR